MEDVRSLCLTLVACGCEDSLQMNLSTSWDFRGIHEDGKRFVATIAYNAPGTTGLDNSAWKANKGHRLEAYDDPPHSMSFTTPMFDALIQRGTSDKYALPGLLHFTPDPSDTQLPYLRRLVAVAYASIK